MQPENPACSTTIMPDSVNSNHPQHVFQLLFHAYGSQHWWPADSPFEMMTGAILTQNTRWTNVEVSIANLKSSGALCPERIHSMHPSELEQHIRSSGFFRQKAVRLKSFSGAYLHYGGISGMRKLENPRKTLLALNGIGPETADSMLLYALELPVFVVDNYTKRIFSRLGIFDKHASYHAVQSYFHQHLASDTQLFNEFHALIVEHAKRHCRSVPNCQTCPLRAVCHINTRSMPP